MIQSKYKAWPKPQLSSIVYLVNGFYSVYPIGLHRQEVEYIKLKTSVLLSKVVVVNTCILNNGLKTRQIITKCSQSYLPRSSFLKIREKTRPLGLQ